jgi:hypothetical protein
MFFRLDRIPGDLGDARFNMYVLEHGYRWLLRLDNSFWSAPFFYPASNVTTYSVNHLGTLLFYVAFRIFGASRESAFQYWALIIFGLNYFLTLLVLRKQNFHPIGAIASAYIFTFPIILVAQIGHLQLAPRFMVPVSFWMAHLFLESGKPRFLCLFFAACAYQIYLDIYIAYFLILSLVPFCAFIFLNNKQWIQLRSFVAQNDIRAILRRTLEYGGACIGFLIVLLPLIVPYYRAQQEMGRRTWQEIVPLLPQWQSYLYAPRSFLWRKILNFGDGLSFNWEHQLFFGLFPYLGLIVFIYLLLKNKLARPERLLGFAMLTVVITLSILTFYFSGFSFYHYVWAYFPGAGGIRAVTRIVLVLVFPIAFVCGTVITYLMNCWPIVRGSWTTSFLTVGILTLIVVDQAGEFPSMSKRECQRRIARLKSRILEVKKNNFDQTALWVNDKSADPFFVKDLDAMLAGQELGLNVVNGYSGFVPQGYPMGMFTLTGDCCLEMEIWAGTHPGTITNNSLLQIGQRCALSDNWMPIPIKGFSGFDVAETVHLWAIDRIAILAIPEVPSNSDTGILSFELLTLNLRSIKISEPDGRTQTLSLIPGRLYHVDMRISLSKKDSVVKFETDAAGVRPGNGDSRTLFFDIVNPRIASAGSGSVAPNQVNDGRPGQVKER